MTLRQKVEAAVAEAMKNHPNDPKAIAMAACKAVELQVDLEGNGWWDGDDEFLQYLRRR